MSRLISMAEKREWLELYEKGKTETQLMKKYGRDIRTIKKGLDDARRERASIKARAELVKDTMRKHHDKLLFILDNLIPVLKIPTPIQYLPWEDQFTAGEIKMEGLTASFDNLITPNIRITFEAEDKPEWELIEEHLKKEASLAMLNKWKKAVASYLDAKIAFKLSLASTLEKNTELKFSKDAVPRSYLYSHSVGVLFNLISERLRRPNYMEDFEQNIVVDKTKGDVRYANSTILVHNPGKEAECRDRILETIKQVIKSEKAKEVIRSENTVEEISEKAKRAVNEILLMGLMPGQCRICSRLGI